MLPFELLWILPLIIISVIKIILNTEQKKKSVVKTSLFVLWCLLIASGFIQFVYGLDISSKIDYYNHTLKKFKQNEKMYKAFQQKTNYTPIPVVENNLNELEEVINKIKLFQKWDDDTLIYGLISLDNVITDKVHDVNIVNIDSIRNVYIELALPSSKLKRDTK